jgi:hypothetical protein
MITNNNTKQEHTFINPSVMDIFKGNLETEFNYHTSMVLDEDERETFGLDNYYWDGDEIEIKTGWDDKIYTFKLTLSGVNIETKEDLYKKIEEDLYEETEEDLYKD